MIEENSDWIIFYSVVNKNANKQGVKTETSCYINGSVNSLHKFINNEQYNAKQQTQVTDFFWLICDTHEMNIQIQTWLYQTSYISKYLLGSLGLRYIQVLLYMCTLIAIYITSNYNDTTDYMYTLIENYATFSRSLTVISLCDLFWYDLLSLPKVTGYHLYRTAPNKLIKTAFVYVLEIQDYARLI